MLIRKSDTNMIHISLILNIFIYLLLGDYLYSCIPKQHYCLLVMGKNVIHFVTLTDKWITVSIFCMHNERLNPCVFVWCVWAYVCVYVCIIFQFMCVCLSVTFVIYIWVSACCTLHLDRLCGLELSWFLFCSAHEKCMHICIFTDSIVTISFIILLLSLVQ